ncbi:hypothetical protein [Roseomonas sp. BN140053]|uniref:hypothetical protein n=1 Tax=Roseomonas sp. BN140053 TaxID=3391898 RepID=UPI0039E765FB
MSHCLRAARQPLRALAPVLPLALVLVGCGADFAPFGRRDGALVAPDSLTVQRITGQNLNAEPLLPEDGNVWPTEEPARTTLANPDQPQRQPPLQAPALERAARERGSPPQPRILSDGPGPAVPPEAAPNPRAPVPGTARRGSGTPPPGPLDPLAPPRVPAARGEPATPPAPRADGRVIPIPGGGPAVTSGGTGSYQTFTTPGGGSGLAVPQGPTTTLIGPEGQVQVVPSPR